MGPGGPVDWHILHYDRKQIGFTIVTQHERSESHGTAKNDYALVHIIKSIGSEIRLPRKSPDVPAYRFRDKSELDTVVAIVVAALKTYDGANERPRRAVKVQFSPWLEFALKKNLLLSKDTKPSNRPVHALTDFENAFFGKDVAKMIRGAMLLEGVGHGSESALHTLLTGAGLADKIAKDGKFESAVQDWAKVVALALKLSRPHHTRSILLGAVARLLGSKPTSISKGAAFGPLIRAMALEIGGPVYWPVFLSAACGGGTNFLKEELWGKVLGELLIEKRSKEAGAAFQQASLARNDFRAPVRNFAVTRARGVSGWDLFDGDTEEHFLSVRDCTNQTTVIDAYRGGSVTATVTLDAQKRTSSLAVSDEDNRQLVVSWDPGSQLTTAVIIAADGSSHALPPPDSGAPH